MLVLDIDNALVAQPFWCIDKGPCPYCRSIGAQVYDKTLDRIKLPARAVTVNIEYKKYCLCTHHRYTISKDVTLI